MKTVELYHNKNLQFVGWPGMLLGLFILIKPMTAETFVLSFEPTKIFAYVIVLVTSFSFIFMGSYIVLMVFNSRLEFDDNELRYQSALRKKVVSSWSSIRSASFGKTSHELLLVTDSGNIKVHNMIKNFTELTTKLKERGICVK